MVLGLIGLAAAIASRAALGHRWADHPANRLSEPLLAVLEAAQRAFVLGLGPGGLLGLASPGGRAHYDPRHCMNPRSRLAAVTGRVLSPNYWYRPRARPSRCRRSRRRVGGRKCHFFFRNRGFLPPYAALYEPRRTTADDLGPVHW